MLDRDHHVIPVKRSSLLALAAAHGTAVLAARLAALALAAVLALDRLGCGSLCDCGYGENECERNQS